MVMILEWQCPKEDCWPDCLQKKVLGSGQEFMLNVDMRQLRSICKDRNSVAGNYLKANIAMITVQNFSIHIDGTVNLGKKEMTEWLIKDKKSRYRERLIFL